MSELKAERYSLSQRDKLRDTEKEIWKETETERETARWREIRQKERKPENETKRDRLRVREKQTETQRERQNVTGLRQRKIGRERLRLRGKQ